RASVDAVVFSGPDALSCDGGVRRLRALGGPTLLAAAGPVANSALGIAEVEAATGLRCLSGEMILDGALTSTLRALREHVHANGAGWTPVGAGDREPVPRAVGAGRAAS